MTQEEENIWRSIRQKDKKAFENYYLENYRFFLLASCRYIKDSAKAQEIINDVFLKLWQDAGIIDLRTSLKYYLHRAVVNRCLNELDREKRDRRRQSDQHIPLAETEVSNELEDAELRLRLYQAIDRLPAQCRKVFKMSRFEQLKQQEIARRLGISVKTVKNHITRALQELAKIKWLF